MKRKIYTQLKEWKEKKQGREALLIDGARRIGKSYIVEEFARQEYKSYILIDFNSVDSDITELFEHYLSDLDTLFSRLQLHTGRKLYERESLIIFDEVQQCPRARAAIKYLVADGRYDYIETGSLMSINQNVKDIVIPSEEHRIDMYPMDLEEFLWAMGDEMMMDYVRECYQGRKPLGRSYFYSKSSTIAEERMEIDFMIGKANVTSRHNIVPIEVKSSNRFTTSSLDKCRKRFAEQVTDPIVLYTGDVERKDSVSYLPIYMTGLLGK